MWRECRERFSRHRGLAIQTCTTARAWRTCRDACRDRLLAVPFEVGGGIPGAWATRNLTYLVRGPYTSTYSIFLCALFFWNDKCIRYNLFTTIYFRKEYLHICVMSDLCIISIISMAVLLCYIITHVNAQRSPGAHAIITCKVTTLIQYSKI